MLCARVLVNLDGIVRHRAKALLLLCSGAKHWGFCTLGAHGKHRMDDVVEDNKFLADIDDAINVEKVRTSSQLNETNGGPVKKAKLQLPVEPFVSSLSYHIERAWDHWRKLGQPKLMVAPMVDQSELPFRMLCRKYGATGAYTPMLHSRLYSEDSKYRSNEFTTCPGDRPLLVQFCANNPDTLLTAAKLVEPFCDYVDLNLGCPQRIAKRGKYGAFLMDDLPLIQSLVSKLASNLQVPVACKIRIFPNLEETVSYAKMLESAGCSLLAVHGRTREHKCSRTVRADWDAIRAVKNALRIPVLGNGNIRWLEDAENCIRETGVDGVLSAESLLENPALFAGYRISGPSEENFEGKDSVKSTDPATLLLEYLDLCEKYPVPHRMIRAHVHKLLGSWFKVHQDLREKLNKESKLSLEWLRDLANEMMERIRSKKAAAAVVVAHPSAAPESIVPLGAETT